MTEPEAIDLVLTHYRIVFPGTDWATVSAAWQTEYNAVASGAFSAVLITAMSFEGGNSSAQRNFEQAIRLRGLQLRRKELDPAFACASAASAPQVMYPIIAQGAFNH